MNRNRFSEEQMTALAANPYTKAVFPTTIKFTDEFKAEFLRLYNQGCFPREIFVKLGYDPKIIGESRMSNTAYLISQSRKRHVIKEMKWPDWKAKSGHCAKSLIR